MKKQSNKTTSWIDGILKMYFLMVIFTGFFSISEQGIHIFKFFCIAFNFFNSLFQPFERKKKLRFDVMKRWNIEHKNSWNEDKFVTLKTLMESELETPDSSLNISVFI